MEETLRKLGEIGFSDYEAKAYYNLLRKRIFTAKELSKLSEIPRSKIYEILKRLTSKGACTQVPGKVNKYKAIPPNMVFRKYQRDLDEKKKLLNKISAKLMPVYNSAESNSSPLNYIEVLNNRNAVVNKLNELNQKAEKQVLEMNKPPFFSDLKAYQKVDINRFKPDPNIEYKYLYELHEKEKELELKILESFQKLGFKIKIHEKLPLKFINFDNETILLSLKDKISNSESMTSIVIEHRDLAYTLAEIFNVYWEKSLKINEYKNRIGGKDD